jgi:hypothetical protein
MIGLVDALSRCLLQKAYEQHHEWGRKEGMRCPEGDQFYFAWIKGTRSAAARRFF